MDDYMLRAFYSPTIQPLFPNRVAVEHQQCPEATRRFECGCRFIFLEGFNIWASSAADTCEACEAELREMMARPFGDADPLEGLQ